MNGRLVKTQPFPAAPGAVLNFPTNTTNPFYRTGGSGTLLWTTQLIPTT